MSNVLKDIQKKHLELEEDEKFFREVQIEFLIHELKDPISIIATGTKTLLEKRERYGPLSPRQEKTLERVARNTKKAWEMLNDLLETGRSEAGCFICHRFRPAMVVYDVLMYALETKAAALSEQCKNFTGPRQVLEFLSASGIALEIAPQAADVEIFQDENKFRLMVGNMIKNALHYRKAQVVIRINCDNDRLLIDVTDDGPGIGPEDHAKIFKRYKQIHQCSKVSRQGHGLGLSCALIVARRLGGDIELKSAKGQGATFRLIIPVKGGLNE